MNTVCSKNNHKMFINNSDISGEKEIFIVFVEIISWLKMIIEENDLAQPIYCLYGLQ